MPDLSSSSHGQNSARVAVVGVGIVSPVGFGLAETLASLRDGKDCVGPVTMFPVDRTRCKTAGQVKDERLAAANEHHPRHPERLHRVAQMMILAMKEALGQAQDFKPELTVMGTTSG